MVKIALLQMGCVYIVSKAKAIRIMRGKEELSGYCCDSININDLSDEQRIEIARDLGMSKAQSDAKYEKWKAKQRKNGAYVAD